MAATMLRARLMLLMLALLAAALVASCRGGGDEPSLAPVETPSATPEATPSATPSATPEPTASATPSATPEPTASVPPEPTPSATPEPTASATPEATPSATPKPTASATPEPTPTALDLPALYDYGLELINKARREHGVPLVVLSENPAAQRHAEDLAANCTRGHWGADGLGPDMRYNLAGGYQASAENVGNGRCGTTLGDPQRALERQLAQLMASPGHRATLLDPKYRQVSMGIAHNGGRHYWWVQYFEGDYIGLSELPRLDGSVLTFAGETRNGARVSASRVLANVRYYPLPEPIPAGERSELGNYVLPPLLARVLPPGAARTGKATEVTTSRFRLDGDGFAVTADLGDRMVGPGVYSVRVFGVVEGSHTTIAEYNIFAEEAPGSDPPLLPEPWVPIAEIFDFSEPPRLDGKVLSFAGRFGSGWGPSASRYVLTIQHEWEMQAFKRVGDEQGSPRGQEALWDSAGPPVAWVVAPGSEWDGNAPRVGASDYSYDGRELMFRVDLGEVIPDRGVITITVGGERVGRPATYPSEVAIASIKIPPQ